MEALARHFTAFCSIPAFYDLLTSSPALTQIMISFLGDEVCERQNLGHVCHNLYQVAGAMGFKWRKQAVNVPQQFRTRIFDNRRPYIREQHSQLFSGPEEKARSDVLWVEAAVRSAIYLQSASDSSSFGGEGRPALVPVIRIEVTETTRLVLMPSTTRDSEFLACISGDSDLQPFEVAYGNKALVARVEPVNQVYEGGHETWTIELSPLLILC